MAARYFRALARGNGSAFVAVTTPGYRYTTLKGKHLNRDQALASVARAASLANASGTSLEDGNVTVSSVGPSNASGGGVNAVVLVSGTFMEVLGGRADNPGQVTHQQTHTLTFVQGSDGKWRVAADAVTAAKTTY